LRVIIAVVQVGAVKIYVAAVEALRKKERRYETQFTTKIGGKLVWDPAIPFCKIFVPSYVFDALLCRNWHSRPLIALTLRITVLWGEFFYRILLILVLDNGLGVGGVPELCLAPSWVCAYFRNSSL
jgi:hypothetical protein